MDSEIKKYFVKTVYKSLSLPVRKDLQRIPFPDAERSPDLLRNNDTPQIVDPPYYPRRFHIKNLRFTDICILYCFCQ